MRINGVAGTCYVCFKVGLCSFQLFLRFDEILLTLTVFLLYVLDGELFIGLMREQCG